MEWRPPGLSLCLPIVILPCTIKSRRTFLLAPAHLACPRRRSIKWLWCGACVVRVDYVTQEAAKILRLLHIRELRELQTLANEAIIAVQSLTANPKTDTKLGKVGI